MAAPQPTTDCQCPAPPEGTEWFWCDRHQCRKSAGMQRQCATNLASFTAWQQGRGTGQVVTATTPVPSMKEKASAPREWSWRSVKHFVRALLKHAGDWFRKCSRKEIQARLAICEQCDQYTGTACAKCGCRVNLEKRFLNKLAWRSEACPLGKWPALSAHRWGSRHRTPSVKSTFSHPLQGESHGRKL